MRNRVLFLMQLPPPVHGASLVNKLIADSQLVKDNYETKILELKFVSQLNEIGNFSWKKIALIFPFIFRLTGTLIKFRPTLVYYTLAPKGFAFYRDALFVFIIKLFRKKIAFHLHSRGIQNTIKSSRIKKSIYRFVFKNQTAISLSNSLSYEFDELGAKEILVLPNGIPDHDYQLSAREHSIPVIIFLANLFRDKGILDFLDIVKELKSKNLRFKANVVGKDGDITFSELVQLAEQKGITDVLTISGALYGEQKYKALSEASIFVHPSLNEAFPLTILEAMQASMPIVASAVGAIPDMVVEGIGYVCPPGDVEAFAKRLTLLIEGDSLRKETSKRSRREYEMHYTIQQFNANLKKTIDHLINRN
jgi:glycosyltransferase involved in cell wall biosynthesis